MTRNRVHDAIVDLPPLRDVIARHGLSARKGLGQHFLLDLNLTAKIARAAGDLAGGTTIEVGPGPGGLTRALLLAGAGRVVAVERDARCVEALQPLVEVSDGRLEVVAGDALELDVKTAGAAPRRIVANLPYNIATPLLLGWIGQADALESMTLMFQKEVAERIVAPVGDAAYGRLSVIAQWRCTAELAVTVSARAFTPPPKVDSAVVRLRPHPTPPFDCRRSDLEQVTAAAFGQRRKMLRRSLAGLGVDVGILLEEAGIGPTLRAESLSVADFARLARCLNSLREGL